MTALTIATREARRRACVGQHVDRTPSRASVPRRSAPAVLDLSCYGHRHSDRDLTRHPTGREQAHTAPDGDMTTHKPIQTPCVPDASEPLLPTDRLEEDALLAGVVAAATVRAVHVGGRPRCCRV
jgi:hypothetical protein